LSKLAKNSTVILLMLLLSAFAVALSPNVLAQTDDAQVVIIATPPEGGTTDPEVGTYNYPNNTIVTLTATPNDGYAFSHWVIQGGYVTQPNQPPLILPYEYIDPNTGEVTGPQPAAPPSTASTFESMSVTQNPLVVACGYGYTFSYEAVFIATAPAERPYAVVVVKESPGGTTDPGAGTYTFTEGSSITLTATPDDGYEFQYWTASGAGSGGHPTVINDNPLSPTCGIGYTYDYQPVFAPVGTTTTSGGVPAEYLYAIIIVLVIIAVIGIGAALMYRGRGK
jgi:hypothetical protein